MDEVLRQVPRHPSPEVKSGFHSESNRLASASDLEARIGAELNSVAVTHKATASDASSGYFGSGRHGSAVRARRVETGLDAGRPVRAGFLR